MINTIDTNYINNLLNKAEEVIQESNQESIQESIQEETKKETKKESNQELIEKAQRKLEEIKDLEGLEIELAGCWIWLAGETKAHKEELKELGFKYASKKQLWYYNPDTNWKRRGTKGKDGKYTYKDYTIDEIHQRYETTKIK